MPKFSFELQNTPFYFYLHSNIGVILHYKDVRIAQKLYKHLVTDYTVEFMSQTQVLNNWGLHLHKDLILYLKPYV